MKSFSETAPHRCLIMMVGAVIAASGCSSGPEIRVAGQNGSPVTIVEGKRLLEQGRAVDAVAAFRKHLRVEGPDLQSLNGLAIAYGELGRADLAAEMFSRALAITPDDPATLNNIGFAALRRADAGLARHYLERARDRSDNVHEIAGNLERLALLEAFERKPSPGRVHHRSAPTSSDGQTTSVHLLTLPDAERSLASITPMPKARPSRSPPITMIDFTAVIDPFMQGRERSHAQ